MTVPRHAPPGHATLVDVARVAHVSPSTVSKVVRGMPGVSRELQDLVRRSVREVDYRPSAVARALGGARSPALLTLAAAGVGGRYPLRLVRELEIAAGAAGARLRIVQTLGDPDTEARLVAEAAGRGAGLVLVGDREPLVPAVTTPQGPPPVLLWTDGPVSSRSALLDRVVVDVGGAVRVCTAHLAASGRRSLALLAPAGPGRRGSAHQRAFVAALRDTCPSVSAHRTRRLRTGSSAEAVLATHDLLRRHPDVDGIVTGDDATALGVLHALATRGRRVPEDVSVTGIGDDESARWCTPTLTTVALPIAQLARDAVHLLQQRLDGDTGPARSATHAGRLVVRHSSRPPHPSNGPDLGCSP